MFLFFLGIYLGTELLGHMASLCLFRNWQTVLQSVPFYQGVLRATWSGANIFSIWGMELRTGLCCSGKLLSKILTLEWSGFTNLNDYVFLKVLKIR